MMERIAYLVIGASVAVVLMTYAPLLESAQGRAAVSGPVPARPRRAPPDAGDMAQPTTADIVLTGLEGTAHEYPLRPVADGLTAPRVSHLMFADPMDGYNIQILARNFTFMPGAINREVKENAGHAHVYVNGVKVARAYSAWFHLPAAMLQPGVNLVTVTLNANDHSVWAKDGVPIASTVRVTGPSL